jgi:hypothetical protein
VSSTGPDRLASSARGLADEQLADTPMGLWLMQEPSGTTMTDSSGNGRNGTYTSVTLGQAPLDPSSDYSVKFAGATSSYATVPTGAWMNVNQWTIECLVKCNWTASQYQTPMSRWDGNLGTYTWIHRNGRSDLFGWSSIGTQYGGTPAGTTMSNNVTYLLTATWNTSTNRMTTYLNGAFNYEVATANNARAVTVDMHFGLSSLSSYPYQGYLSHGAIYDGVLSDARILAHAQAAGLA